MKTLITIIILKTFLYTAYADDTTVFFLTEEKYVTELIKIFDIFSCKCEIAALGARKGLR